ncbi:MAG: hypothetical protein CMJ49_01975 [Planctomycetaceae bacterium]|nr:hypothetical protein [Planctomycetaceae bacterium]
MNDIPLNVIPAPTDRPVRTAVGYRAAVSASVVAGLFSLVVAVLMVITFWHLGTDNPLDAPEHLALKQALRDSPLDAQIKQQIRESDRQLRSTYFSRRAFSDFGAYLLIGGVTMMLLTARLAAACRARAPMPSRAGQPTDDDNTHPRATSWSVGALAVITIVAAAFLTIDFRDAPNLVLASQTPAPTEPSTIATRDERPPVAATAVWPSFRGPGGLGVADATDLPTDWGGATRTNIRWSTPIALPGHNSPVVWGDRIFCTGADKAGREMYCFDAHSGSLLWSRAVPNVVGRDIDPPIVMADTGFAAPTAATDGQRVYAIFANGDLIAFDFDGNQVWAESLGAPSNHYGHASSLITYNNLLLVQFDQGYVDEGMSSLIAFDGGSGRRAWQTPRDVDVSWTSPIIVPADGHDQLITLAEPWVIAYDPSTSRQLWRSGDVFGEVAPSVAWGDGMVFAVSPGSQLQAVRVDGRGDVSNTHIAWTTTDDIPDIVSPTCDGRYVYLLTTSGTLTCLDSTDGSTAYRQKLGARFRSSPIIAGERIYVTSKRGVTLILRAGPAFEQLAQCDLGEPVNSTPAFVDGRIYIRTEKNMICIEHDTP